MSPPTTTIKSNPSTQSKRSSMNPTYVSKKPELLRAEESVASTQTTE